MNCIHFEKLFGLSCKRPVPKWRVMENSAKGFIQTTILPIKSFSSSNTTLSTSVKDGQQQQSFTVSYLINSCGLSLESAVSASKMVRFETPSRPNSALTLLRDRGFTETQITKLIRTRPQLLTADHEKTLLPKLEFFHSLDISSTDLAKILSSNPNILGQSLEKHLMSWRNFLKSVLLDDKKIVRALKSSARIFCDDVQKNFAPNIAILRQLGVPENIISLTITCYSTVVLQNREKFDKIVKVVIEMGFDPEKAEFIHAMQVFSSMSKSTLQHKMEVYTRCGWSQDDIQLAFRKNPLYLNLSEKKIVSMMNFLVNEMGYSCAAIARIPTALCYSLEKRVIPRCSVIKALQSKDLIKKDMHLSTYLHPTEKNFLDKFVTKYLKHAPQLLNVYQGKSTCS